MQIPENIVKMIKSGGVGVMPTDTIFGIVASVNFPDACERIYEVKDRPKNKQMIHLIGDISQLPTLGIHLDDVRRHALEKLWPGPVSVILDCDNTMPHAHGGSYTIAVRLPDSEFLRNFVMETGPIIATSANKSGRPTPSSLAEIKKQLPGLDFYVDGETGSSPSRLARLLPGGKLEWLSRD